MDKLIEEIEFLKFEREELMNEKLINLKKIDECNNLIKYYTSILNDLTFQIAYNNNLIEKYVGLLDFNSDDKLIKSFSNGGRSYYKKQIIILKNKNEEKNHESKDASLMIGYHEDEKKSLLKANEKIDNRIGEIDSMINRNKVKKITKQK